MTEISTTRSGNVLVPYVNAKKRTKHVDNSVLAISSTQPDWTVTGANGYAYSDSNGKWRFAFNCEGTYTPDSIAGVDIRITGVVFKNLSNFYQEITGRMGPAASYRTFVTPNDNQVSIQSSVALASGGASFSGDVELESKPTWADAHMEDVAAVDVFIAENSLPGSKMLDNSIPVSKLVGSGSGPAGMVVAFPAATAPTGWAICDGSEVSKTTYASLFSTIGTTWDTCTNPLTGATYSSPVSGNFRLPDLRGTFLRGAGNFGDVSKDTALGGFQGDKTKKNGLEVAGGTASLDSAGSVDIGHSHGTHTHNIGFNRSDMTAGGTVNTVHNGGGPSFQDTSSSPTIQLASTSVSVSGASMSNTAASISASDSETRPQNVGVNFIIKLFD